MSTNSLIGLLTYMIPFTALCLVTGITIHIRDMETEEQNDWEDHH